MSSIMQTSESASSLSCNQRTAPAKELQQHNDETTLLLPTTTTSSSSSSSSSCGALETEDTNGSSSGNNNMLHFPHAVLPQRPAIDVVQQRQRGNSNNNNELVLLAPEVLLRLRAANASDYVNASCCYTASSSNSNNNQDKIPRPHKNNAVRWTTLQQQQQTAVNRMLARKHEVQWQVHYWTKLEDALSSSSSSSSHDSFNVDWTAVDQLATALLHEIHDVYSACPFYCRPTTTTTATTSTSSTTIVMSLYHGESVAFALRAMARQELVGGAAAAAAIEDWTMSYLTKVAHDNFWKLQEQVLQVVLPSSSSSSSAARQQQQQQHRVKRTIRSSSTARSSTTLMRKTRLQQRPFTTTTNAATSTSNANNFCASILLQRALCFAQLLDNVNAAIMDVKSCCKLVVAAPAGASTTAASIQQEQAMLLIDDIVHALAVIKLDCPRPHFDLDERQALQRALRSMLVGAYSAQGMAACCCDHCGRQAMVGEVGNKKNHKHKHSATKHKHSATKHKHTTNNNSKNKHPTNKKKHQPRQQRQRALHVCQACRSVRYCGLSCQLQAWKDGHKHECGAPEFMLDSDRIKVERSFFARQQQDDDHEYCSYQNSAAAGIAIGHNVRGKRLVLHKDVWTGRYFESLTNADVYFLPSEVEEVPERYQALASRIIIAEEKRLLLPGVESPKSQNDDDPVTAGAVTSTARRKKKMKSLLRTNDIWVSIKICSFFAMWHFLTNLWQVSIGHRLALIVVVLGLCSIFEW